VYQLFVDTDVSTTRIHLDISVFRQNQVTYFRTERTEEVFVNDISIMLIKEASERLSDQVGIASSDVSHNS